MTKPLDLGSLECLGLSENSSILALLNKCGLQDIACSLGAAGPEFGNHLAKLTWRAIRGRRTTSESRMETARQLEQLRLAIAGLGEDAEFALVAQGVNVAELASQATRASVGDRNGRPHDVERDILIAELQAVEKIYTGKTTSYTYDDLEESYKGPLFTMLRVVESAVASAQGTEPPSDGALAKFISRVRATQDRERTRMLTDDELRAQGKSWEEARWPTLSPIAREAHNRLRRARGLPPIPDPKEDKTPAGS
jgi:hypothetical protein